jgi:hypothetical protein
MMRAALLSPLVLACAACVQSSPEGAIRAAAEPLRVTNMGQPFQMWDGAAARKLADAQCGGRGVKVSIYDRFDRACGAWVYPGGCA